MFFSSRSPILHLHYKRYILISNNTPLSILGRHTSDAPLWPLQAAMCQQSLKRGGQNKTVLMMPRRHSRENIQLHFAVRPRSISAHMCSDKPTAPPISIYTPDDGNKCLFKSGLFSVCLRLYLGLMAGASPSDSPPKKCGNPKQSQRKGNKGNWEWAESVWGASNRRICIKNDCRLIQRRMPYTQRRLPSNLGADDGGKCKMSLKKWIRHTQEGWKFLTRFEVWWNHIQNASYIFSPYIDKLYTEVCIHYIHTSCVRCIHCFFFF